MTDPTYRMSMLPLGTYANPDGTESLGLAVPGMIQEPVNALMRLFGSGNFAQGPDYPGNADDMRTLLFSMYGGNAMNPAGLVERSGIRDMAQGAYRDFKYANEPSPILKDHVITGAEYSYPVSVHPAFDPPPFSGELPANDTLFGTLYDHPPFEGAYGDALVSQSRKNFQPNLSVIDGDLLSDTGKPSLMGSAIAGAEAPQRMYHGTGSADDFSHFIPSETGAFGPGVYLSREAESTNPYAFNGPNPRVMPVDVSGPLATYDDYLAARNASPDPAATIQSLLDKGFSGVSVDNATPKGSVNVTNVFRPGSVRSATTGETLFSDGLPSLWGNALAPSQEPKNALMDYAQNDQSHMWDHRDQPPVEDYQSVLPSDMNQFRLNWMRQYRSSHPGSGPEDAYDAYLKSPEYKEKLKGSKQIPFDQIPPGEFIPHR